MNFFIGSKMINAEPMERMRYNDLRGWATPEDECPHDEGYLVEYLDGGKPCHPDFKGYISWSPKDVFEKAYNKSGEMTFGDAIVCMKLGMKVSRAGWNGKGMWLVFVKGTPDAQLHQGSPYYLQGGLDIVTIDPHIDMYTAGGTMQPGWLASQADMLAYDWGIVE